jgi:hypothetical protein
MSATTADAITVVGCAPPGHDNFGGARAYLVVIAYRFGAAR